MRKNREVLNNKLLHMMLTSVILIMICLSSCKYANKQNEMLDTLEKNGVKVPAELREEVGFAWADVLFPLVIFVSLGLISFFAFRRFKNKADDIGYSFGEMKNKTDSLTNNEEIHYKMCTEEKKGLEDLQNLFGNKKK